MKPPRDERLHRLAAGAGRVEDEHLVAELLERSRAAVTHGVVTPNIVAPTSGFVAVGRRRLSPSTMPGDRRGGVARIRAEIRLTPAMSTTEYIIVTSDARRRTAACRPRPPWRPSASARRPAAPASRASTSAEPPEPPRIYGLVLDHAPARRLIQFLADPRVSMSGLATLPSTSRGNRGEDGGQTPPTERAYHRLRRGCSWFSRGHCSEHARGLGRHDVLFRNRGAQDHAGSARLSPPGRSRGDVERRFGHGDDALA